MSLNQTRIRAIFRKEVQEHRHNASIVATMAAIPLIFIVLPLVTVLRLPATGSSALLQGHPLAILLGIPAIVPAVIAAYSVAGERQQGTLEPVLTTPIRREEFLLAKALATFVPSLAMSIAVYGFFLACVALFANPAVASAVIQGPDVFGQLLFTPLLAAWSIWVGIAISAMSSDLRVAQQLGSLASLPPLAVIYLIAFNVIHVTIGLALGIAGALLFVDALGWRLVTPMFDRERLIIGTK